MLRFGSICRKQANGNNDEPADNSGPSFTSLALLAKQNLPREMSGVRRAFYLNEDLRICLERERMWIYDINHGRTIRLKEWGIGSSDSHLDSIDLCEYSEHKQILRNKEESEKIARQDLDHLVSQSAKGTYVPEKLLALEAVPISSTSTAPTPYEYIIYLVSSLEILYSYCISI